MIHLPALLGTGVTPRAGCFGLGRRCLFLEAILPSIPGPGLGQRHLGHCARIPETKGEMKWLWFRGWKRQKVQDGESGVAPPNSSAFPPLRLRHYILSATNGLCVQQLVLWLIPLLSILSLVFGACRKSLRVYNWDRVCVDLLRHFLSQH